MPTAVMPKDNIPINQTHGTHVCVRAHANANTHTEEETEDEESNIITAQVRDPQTQHNTNSTNNTFVALHPTLDCSLSVMVPIDSFFVVPYRPLGCTHLNVLSHR